MAITAVSRYLSDRVATCYQCVQNCRKSLTKDQEINDEAEGDGHNTDNELTHQ